MIDLTLKIAGLNPYDRDILLTKFELIKDKLYPSLDIDFTMLKSYPNSIYINHKFEDSECEMALQLYNLLKGIKFEKTEYERCQCKPCFIINMEFNIVDENYGNLSGLMTA